MEDCYGNTNMSETVRRRKGKCSCEVVTVSGRQVPTDFGDGG